MSLEKIILIGNGTFLNRGCEAIVEGTLKIIEKSFNNACIKNYYFAGNINQSDYNNSLTQIGLRLNVTHLPIPWIPEDKRYSWTWVLSQIGRKIAFHDLGYFYYRNFQRAIQNCIDDFDVALQIGGDNYTLDYGFPLKHAAMDATLSKKGRSVVLWGASVGPFYSRKREEKWLIQHFHKYVRLIMAREPETIDYLRKCNLGERTHLMGDPAFVMDPSIPPEGMINLDLIAGSIGLNLSPLLARYRNPGGDMGQWIKDAGSLIRALRERFDENVLLIPHVTQSGNNDSEFMLKAVKEAGMKEGDYIAVPQKLKATELKWIISKLKLLIAARTHATIAGFSSCVPTISIAYSNKAVGLNRRIFGNQDYVIQAKELTIERLLKAADRAIERSDEICGCLKNVIPVIQREAYGGGEILRWFLNSNINDSE